MTRHTPVGAECVTEYVTVVLDGQWFGLPIARVQDVFMPELLRRVGVTHGEVDDWVVFGVASCAVRGVGPIDTLVIELSAAPQGRSCCAEYRRGGEMILSPV